MELADLLLTVFRVGCPVGLTVAFIWKIYRRGIWGSDAAGSAGRAEASQWLGHGPRRSINTNVRYDAREDEWLG